MHTYSPVHRGLRIRDRYRPRTRHLQRDEWWTSASCDYDRDDALQGVPAAKGCQVSIDLSPLPPSHMKALMFIADHSRHRYIIAQILGAYVACLIIYLQWKHIIVVLCISPLRSSLSFPPRFSLSFHHSPSSRTHPLTRDWYSSLTHY